MLQSICSAIKKKSCCCVFLSVSLSVRVIGKTALANTLIGRSFEDTPSTIGITQFTCDIKYANVGSGKWSEYEKPDKEMEAAIAEMIANGLALEAADETHTRDSEPTAMPVHPDAGEAGGAVSTSHTTTVGNSAVEIVAGAAEEEVYAHSIRHI